jgi:CheY-like chemotaxis protein
MVSHQSILTISRDQVLQHTRTLILEQAGYAVCAAHSDQEALAFLDVSEGYSLVLMCHSVPEPSRISLANAMKAKFPSMPILMLYNGYDPTGAHLRPNPK